MVQEGERDRVAFERGVDGQVAAFDAGVWDPVVAERGEGAEAAGVDEAAVVVEHVHVGAQGPYLAPRDEAEGFRR